MKQTQEDPKIFRIRISNETFEQSSISRQWMDKTYSGGWLYPVENILILEVRFDGYLYEGDEAVGARFCCVLDANGAMEMVELRPGEVHSFRYEGISVDDDGCPEDFVIDYHMCLEPWGEE